MSPASESDKDPWSRRVRFFSASHRGLPSPPSRVAHHDEISGRRDPLHNAIDLIGSNRGHATTDTDIRFKSRFETSGEFHRDIPPPTPRSGGTVCAVTGGNIAELAATAFVAPLVVLLSDRTIGFRGEQCGGGESVSQSPLTYKLFFISARGHLRSSLPVIGSSAPPAPQASVWDGVRISEKE